MAPINEEEITRRLSSLPEWTREDQSIRRQFVFDGFASAVAFVVRVGFDAEAADHHPDIHITGYRRVTLAFTTHSARGLTEKDFEGAAKADSVFARGAGGELRK